MQYWNDTPVCSINAFVPASEIAIDSAVGSSVGTQTFGKNNTTRTVKAKRNVDMSYCCAFSNVNGYVMASDSRSIFEGPAGSIYKTIDNFRKIVYLPRSKTSVICAGQNTFNGKEITALLLEYDANFDLSAVDLAEALKLLSEHVRSQRPDNSVQLCIARTTTEKIPMLYYTNITSMDISENPPATH